ncbi:MAG: HI1506-related protein [Peptococcaceae bacterium]|jgi:hypothetical protein|nr:HI1506-related protein [Peptococcaceae bacterium]MDH7526037.1 HI1506-related protein [Peptococcaceae bacterium]
MAVKIISKMAGFRRCGITHPAGPTVYPDGTFDEKQLAILQAEPMLIVEVIPEEPEGDLLEGNLDPAQLETMKFDDLKKLAQEMGLEIPARPSKAILIELIAAQTVFAPKDKVTDQEPGDEQ